MKVEKSGKKWIVKADCDGLGEELQVVWELELGRRIIEKAALPDPTEFDPPNRLNAFLDSRSRNYEQ